MRKITYRLALILMFIIPWENSISIATLGSIARLVGFVVAAFWGATMLLEGRFRKPHFFHALVLLFFLWNLTSFFWSLNIENTVQRIKTYSQFFLLMLIYWEMFQNDESLMAGLQAYVFGGYVLIISTIYNYINGNAAIIYQERYSATGINANELSLILIIGLPISMHLFFRGGVDEDNRLIKLVNLAFVPSAICAIILSGTRTSIIAIIPFILYLMGTQQIKFSRKVIIFVIFLVSLFIIFPFIPSSVINRLGTIGTSIGQGDLGGRLNLWREGITIFAQHPIWGIGSGAVSSSIGSAVHNTFISIAAETGFIGLILFFSILGMVIFQMFILPKSVFGLWLSIFMILVIGIFTLSWEFRKLTWLVLSLVVIEGSVWERVVTQRASALFSRVERSSSVSDIQIATHT